jgi:hypothetical protein
MPLKKSYKKYIRIYLTLFLKFKLTSYRSIVNDSKIVDKALAVEEVIGSYQKIPGQRTKPWQTMNFIHGISDVDDLRETFYLYGQRLRVMVKTCNR